MYDNKKKKVETYLQIFLALNVTNEVQTNEKKNSVFLPLVNEERPPSFAVRSSFHPF